MALNPTYAKGFVEGCLEWIREDEPEGEDLFKDLWEDEGERKTVLQIPKAECQVLPGRHESFFSYQSKGTHRLSRCSPNPGAHPVIKLALSFRTSMRTRSRVGAGRG